MAREREPASNQKGIGKVMTHFPVMASYKSEKGPLVGVTLIQFARAPMNICLVDCEAIAAVNISQSPITRLRLELG